MSGGLPLMIRRGSSRTAGRRVAGAQVYSVRIPPDALAALRRLAEARGQLPSVLIRGWVLERLRQETTGEELLVSRDELARIVREQVEAALRKAS